MVPATGDHEARTLVGEDVPDAEPPALGHALEHRVVRERKVGLDHTDAHLCEIGVCLYLPGLGLRLGRIVHAVGVMRFLNFLKQP